MFMNKIRLITRGAIRAGTSHCVTVLSAPPTAHCDRRFVRFKYSINLFFPFCNLHIKFPRPTNITAKRPQFRLNHDFTRISLKQLTFPQTSVIRLVSRYVPLAAAPRPRRRRAVSLHPQIPAACQNKLLHLHPRRTSRPHLHAFS